jgi:hypothetical protein
MPYETDPLMRLEITGTEPATVTSREGNGEGGALGTPTVVIARYLMTNGADQSAAFVETIRKAGELGTKMTSVECADTSLGPLLTVGGYKDVVGASRSAVSFTGSTPGEILVSFHPNGSLGPDPSVPEPPTDPDCSPELLAAISDAH